jgi:hypothetical protein
MMESCRLFCAAKAVGMVELGSIVTQQSAYDDQVHHDRLGSSMPVKSLAVVEVVGGFKICSSLQGT